jgi:hypothetical protein
MGKYVGMYKNTPPAVIKAVLSIHNKKSNYCFWYLLARILEFKKEEENNWFWYYYE